MKKQVIPNAATLLFMTRLYFQTNVTVTTPTEEDAYRWLCAEDLVVDEVDGLNDKGRFYVESLLRVPLPRTSMIAFDGEYVEDEDEGF